MPMSSNTLDSKLDSSWRSACRIIFGREIGPLAKYQAWLGASLPRGARRKSHLSGKDVAVAFDAFPSSARFVSSEELQLNRGYGVSVNDMKDVDSLLGALSEKCEYAGNRHLGNSAFVESSDIVLDSQYVRNSTNVEESQYVDSSFMIRKGSKHIFGCGALGNGEFLIRVTDSYGQKRSLESSMVGTSSDCYFCHNVLGSREMMFSFGQRNKSYCIGNTQLPKEKYLELKRKILAEVADILEKEGSFPSLGELVPNVKPRAASLALAPEKQVQNMAPIEKGFATTYNILLKRLPGSIKDYEGWLSARTIGVHEVVTSFGSITHVPDSMPVLKDFPRQRLVTARESFELAKLQMPQASMTGLEGVLGALGDMAYFTNELSDGQNSNLIACPHAYNVVNAYKGYDGVYAENVALSSMALNSKYAYGCHRVLESQFSLKCYNSQYLNRCMELDSCNRCADSYFCHNSEALSECMFCFNMKGARHTIGNTALPKEQYAQVKGALVGQIADELGKSKGLRLSVFGIAGKG
ncbi:MAG: hypothetical protein NTX79_05420 [Candidatus Micrarchaeota archaeon]|nr:hypothetical protein [Candidatus Micrarchaeota archaeon]